MTIKLKCAGKFERSFLVNGRTIRTIYEIWSITDDKNTQLGFKHLTADSYLSCLLERLENKPLDDAKLKIIEAMLYHSNRWRIFEKALEIYDSEGLEKTLEFLEDKFSLVILGEKLQPRWYR